MINDEPRWIMLNEDELKSLDESKFMKRGEVSLTCELCEKTFVVPVREAIERLQEKGICWCYYYICPRYGDLEEELKRRANNKKVWDKDEN